jgi:hypothetical protein
MSKELRLGRLVCLELNEVNFEYVKGYIDKGLLPNFRKFLDKHGYAETTSETEYEKLEPWIQWVTAHTGMSLAEHGVFRLGDIVNTDIEQIWERLANRGISVGAVSPMNAKCRGNKWDFFVPDPWTKTDIIAPPAVRRLYSAIAQVVNDNAQSRVTLESLFNLATGWILTAAPKRYPLYIKYIIAIPSKPWMKAVFLDLLLSDLFISLVRQNKTEFSTLFLNAAAHIQHHYMFSSGVYDGNNANPSWYINEKHDPLLDVYTAYDKILGTLCDEISEVRIMIATGLHQDPHIDLTYYWRIKNHDLFLKKIGVFADEVSALMSRDFMAKFKDTARAEEAARILNSAKTDDGTKLFDVDNRGNDLFVMFTYPHDIKKVTWYVVGNEKYTNLMADVAFVAIKNGHHNGVGYFSDSGRQQNRADAKIPLVSIPDIITEFFDRNLVT